MRQIKGALLQETKLQYLPEVSNTGPMPRERCRLAQLLKRGQLGGGARSTQKYDVRGKGHCQGYHLTRLLEQEGDLGSMGNKAAVVFWGRIGISRRNGCGEMSFANSQPLKPQPKSRLPERTMVPYSLKHLWTQQDKKLASGSATSWQKAAGTWGKLISGSLSGEDKRGIDSGLGLELRSQAFIMEVLVLEPEMRGFPAILG